MCGWGERVLEGRTMGRGRKSRYTENIFKPEVLFSIIGLFIAFLEYALDLRPKIAVVGLYECGFIDCLIVVLLVLLMVACFRRFKS